MNLEYRIARRYFSAARKQAHTAFLSLISMIGLALAVATLIVSIALLSGLQGQIKGRLIESSPMLLVEPSGSNTIANADAIVAAAKSAGVSDIRPYITGIGYGANEEAGTGRPMRVRSLTPGHEPQADLRSENTPRTWSDDEPQIYLTRGFAAGISLDAGDTITVVAPRTRLTPFGPVPVMRRYRIVRIIMPTQEESTVDAWLSHSDAAALFGTNDQPTGIEMFGPVARAEEVQAALIPKFPGVQFKTWKEINRPLFLALRLEKMVMFATISLIIVVAALNLVSSLSMLILEKRPSVGVLRTLGATDKTIRSLFMQLGLIIGISGTIIGNIVGIAFALAADRWHWIGLRPEVYFVDYLPFTVDVPDVVSVNVVAVLLSVLATWYPARIAARLDPITAIKED